MSVQPALALDALPGVAIAPATLQIAIAALLALVVGVASVRLLLRHARTPVDARPRAWRIAGLLTLQAASAALLYALLFPPGARGDAGALVVLTRDAGRVATATRDPAARTVALPEAGRVPGAERVPDLATALRRWPGTTRIEVIGAGLAARDRDAVAGLPLTFVPAPLPPGIVGLQAPARVPAGRRVSIAVDVHALPGGSVELLDPAGRIADRAPLARNATGSVALRLHDLARSPGLATWRLRVRDAARRELQTVAVPLQVDAGAALRVLMLAGAPNAETKYLRRWATDGGLSLDARIALGGGLAIGDAPASIDDATLARTDLLLLDARSWQRLGDASRASMMRAVRAGMGLLLRLPDAATSQDVARLRALGFATATAAGPTETRLAEPATRPAGSVPDAASDDDASTDRAAPTDGDAAVESGSATPETTRRTFTLPAITRSTSRVTAADGVTLLRDAAGAPLGSWRAKGRGRVGVVTAGETFRLVLAGRPDAYDALWSPVFDALARPAGTIDAAIDSNARVEERLALCSLGDAARVEPSIAMAATTAPRAAVTLRVDPATGARRCAAYWPRIAGWHRLHDGDRDQLFHVRASGDTPGIAAATDRRATLALVGNTARTSAISPGPDTPTAPGPRWPWLLGWLLVSGLLWWLERSGLGARLR